MTEHLVTEQDTAAAVGSGSLPVLASPVLSCWMESLCHTLAAESAAPGETSVGVTFSLTHLAPTGVGGKVRCTAKETERGKHSVTYLAEAFDEGGKIGEAVHKRVYVQEKTFLDKLAAR